MLIPLRRWVGWTPTIVTPAVGILAPPGTIIRNVTAADVPTFLPPSIAAKDRSGSMTGSDASTSSSFAT